MTRVTPKQMIIIAVFLLLLGVLLPFLMVMGVLESTFFMNFLGYACQVTGLFVGMFGIFTVVRINRKKK